MNENIIKTKKRLTIIFTVIVSLVIITFGVSFLSFKYYKNLTIEKRLLNDLGKNLELGKVKIDDFIKFSRIIGDNIKRKDVSKNNDRNIIQKPGKFDGLGPISYVKLKKDVIISYDIKVDLEESFIEKLLDANIYNKSFELDGYLIRKIRLGDEEILIFKFLRYNFSDYLSDILIFLLITFIFSSLLYFIGNRFVNRAFLPVDENIKDMNNFIHNAGHELKTPISVIDSNIQLIKDIKKYDESMMNEMKDETKKLNLLIDSLIKLSDIGDLKTEKESINLKDIINEVLKNCGANISLKNIDVKLKIKKDIFIEVNKSYFYILLSNLIGNAVKYNIKNGKIDIFYENGELMIKDTGIGISNEEIYKIFERFYKVDSSRNTEGFGIGLSLVKKIADIYNWKLIVKSNEDNGSTFIVKF